MKGKDARGYPIEGIRQQQSQTRRPGSPRPTLSEQSMKPFTSCRIVNINKSCETGPTLYHPYSRTLEILTVCRQNDKATLSTQLFKDLESRSAQGLNTQPPARLSDTQPT